MYSFVEIADLNCNDHKRALLKYSAELFVVHRDEKNLPSRYGLTDRNLPMNLVANAPNVKLFSDLVYMSMSHLKLLYQTQQ